MTTITQTTAQVSIHADNQAISQTPRHNLYQAVHKGLRAFMADTLTCIGRTDHADAQECEESAQQLRTLLHVCREHLKHENDFVHAAMERRSPGSAARCAQEHVDHVAHIARLGACLDQTLQAPQVERAQAWQRLYQALSAFVADNYEHMLMEEYDHNAVLWAHYSDEELDGIHHALVSSVPAEEMAIHFRWMLPQLSHVERVGMLSGMRQGMPAEVFAMQLKTAQSLLDTRSWCKLKAALNVGSEAVTA